ncbi:protein of unassigned function [Methylobacterium oryzae CBMB20]|jgi:hypothetical protein|uniref:Protein of unassigned function n=1 Tax=Methylobacterium oryzae CBMB20 TaxID=693986 RepID=A0A089QH25_9HYPH|nr:protein of unassigned function [Methylobacterium oryzae CBMB20]
MLTLHETAHKSRVAAPANACPAIKRHRFHAERTKMAQFPTG